ncbi:MAG: peptide chain release factor N(5)-glutamine methyltransferase [Desulfobulbaceae bacterium]|nr:peptide chain release factor N(5)-glutamine methyltransferase [Desulfobulbaceae bacterium]
MKTLALYHELTRQLAVGGIPDAAVEATLLLRHFLRCRRSDIFLNGAVEVPPLLCDAVFDALRRRRLREPLAYILGEQEFYGRAFSVTPDVLIPRQETELLVDKALLSLRDRVMLGTPRILDLGVGSGIIAITLALELPQATVVGLDLSFPALLVAKDNAIRHQVYARVHWLNSNWAGALRDGLDFDLVVANPPYVAGKLRTTLQPELAAEPASALYGGDDGRADIDLLMHDVARLIRPGGTFLMEIGFDQGDYVVDKMKAMGYFNLIVVHQDYAGLPRLLQASRL